MASGQRAHLLTYAWVKDSNGFLKVSAGVSVTVYKADGVTLFDQTMYNDFTGSTVLSNPLTSDATGKVEAFSDDPETVKLSSGSLVQMDKFEPYDSGPSGP